MNEITEIAEAEIVESEPTVVAAPKAAPKKRKKRVEKPRRTEPYVFVPGPVRRMAMDNGVDIRDVKGSGKKGTVLKQDLLDYMAAQARDPVRRAQLERDGAAPGPTDEEIMSERARRSMNEAEEYAKNRGDRVRAEAEALEERNRQTAAAEKAELDRVKEQNRPRSRANSAPWSDKSWKPDAFRVPKRPGWYSRFVSKARLQRWLDSDFQIADVANYGGKASVKFQDGRAQSTGSAVERGNMILVEIPESMYRDRRRKVDAMIEHRAVDAMDGATRSGQITKEPGRFGRPKKERLRPPSRTGAVPDGTTAGGHPFFS